tara:strand:- start:25 stop:351 length:327 start_codon:yes stop_codon:yes gene_type:complete
MTLIAILTAAAMTASPVPQASLAEVSCDRLAQALTYFHEDTLQWEQRATSRSVAPNPAVAVMTRRMQVVARYMTAHNLPPRPITERDVVLSNASGTDMMTEFERRCRA